MSEPRPSTPNSRSLLAQGVQAELIKLEDLPDDFYVEEEGGFTPDYTAERFFRKRPEDYELCVAFLAAGQGLLKIARILKVHHKTVAAVRDREGHAIDIQKERIKRNIRLAIDIAAERLPDIMATLSASQVPISAAVLIDKLAQLEGEPTQRVEVTVKAHLTHEAIAANIEAFPEAIDVETVSRGESTEQKAPDQASPEPASGDCKSLDDQP